MPSSASATRSAPCTTPARHQEASLSEGEVWDGEIECLLHGSMFSLDTGAPSCLPATKPVPTYDVTVDGDDVLVDATTPANGAPVPDHA